MRKLFTLLIEYIDKQERTQGTETSQYLEEKKVKNDSLSSGERNGRSLNLVTKTKGSGTIINDTVTIRRTSLEYLTIESDSLVFEN